MKKAVIIVFNLAFAGFMIMSAAAEFRKPSPAYGVKAVFEVYR